MSGEAAGPLGIATRSGRSVWYDMVVPLAALAMDPITPPPELVGRLKHLWVDDAIVRAYQAGADWELDACCGWLRVNKGTCFSSFIERDLRAARRPKPPSLKEQALCHLESFAGSIETLGMDSDLIRRALEALPDTEGGDA